MSKIKTREQLTKDLELANRRIAELEASADKHLETEKKLRESNDLFRLILENRDDALWAYSLSADRFTYFSPSIQKLLGYTPEEITALPLRRILTPDSYKFINEMWHVRKPEVLALNSGTISYTDGIDYVCKDGSVAHTEIITTCSKNEQSEIKIVGAFKDIAERKRVQDDMLRIQKAVDSSSDAIGISDSQVRHIYHNKAFTDLFEYTPVELDDFGGGPAAYADQEVAKDVFDTIIRGGSWSGEVQMVSKTRRKLWIQLRADAIKDDHGNIIGFIGVHTDITEQKRTENALKESEAFLRTLVNTIPDLIWMKNPEGIYLFCNSRFEKCFGAEERDIIGKTDYDFVDNESAEVFKAHDASAIAKGIPVRNEEEITFAEDGHHEFLETIRTPIYDNDEKFVGVLGVGRDITERKRAESQRLANLKFFESLDKINRSIHSTNDFEHMMRNVLDTVLTIFDCDRANLSYPCDPFSSACRVPMERSRPQYSGAFQSDVDIPITPFLKKSFQDILKARGPYSIDSEDYPEAEVFKIFNIKSTLSIALYPKIGKPWLFGLHQCSYIRKWTPEEKILFQEIGRRLSDGLTTMLVFNDLQKSEARFRIIFETAADPIFLNDMETGGFLDVNQAACRHLGYEKKDFQSMSISDINAADTFDFHSYFTKDQNKDESLFFESRHVRKDGTVAIVEINSQQMLHQGRKALLSIVRDVTPRKQIEAELSQYRINLETMVSERTAQLKVTQDELIKNEKLAVLGQLTAIVSHELRNPLGVIRSSNFFLQRRFKSTEDKKAEKHFKRIDEQISHCNTIVADLLEYTRRSTTNISRQNLLSWLKEVVEQIKEQEGVDIGLQTPDDLPPVPHDPEKMRRVIINLLNNSVQAVTAKVDSSAENTGTFTPHIDIEVGLNDDHLTITICDNGIGMPPETHRQAFEPLFTTRSRGTGLGLSIVKKIIEEHNGTISMKSRAGEGTKISLDLPCL